MAFLLYNYSVYLANKISKKPMAEDITRKILVDVELRAEQVKKDLPALIGEIDRLTASQKDLEKQGKKSSKEWVDQSQVLRQLKAEVRETNKYIDNTAKAINAESNSIQQNRALLSLLTAEHIKLGQSNGNTKKQVDASAKAINDLTTVLKAQEKAIGQTYRNVGNYADAIREVAGELGNAIPGFQQFQSIVQASTKIAGFMPTAMADISNSFKSAGKSIASFTGFKQFNTEAKETGETSEEAAGAVLELATAEGEAAAGAEGAAESIGGLSAAGGILAGVFAAIGLAVTGAIAYLKRLDSVGDDTQQLWEGVKAGFYAVAESIAKGDWTGLTNKMIAAGGEAAALTAQLQDLQDVMISQEVHQASAENQIADLMLKMRNKRITPEQEQKYFNEIQSISTKNYETQKANAEKLLEIEINKAIVGKKISKEDVERLKKGGTDVAIQLENENKIWAGSYKKIADAQKQKLAADQFYNSVRDRAQNRIDAQDLAREQKQTAAATKAEADARRAEQQRQKEQEALIEAENLRKSSAARILTGIYEDYGDRVLALQQNYDNQIAQLDKFLAKKLISQRVYSANAEQYTAEHEAATAKLIKDFQKKDAEALEKSQIELANLRIASIKNDTNRGVAELEQRNAEQMAVIDKSNDDILEAQRALNIEIAALKWAEQDEAKQRYENLSVLFQQNEIKRVGIQKATDREILRLKRKAANDQQAVELEAAVLKAKKGANLFSNGGAQSAEAAAITQRYDFEISEAKRAGKTTVLLEEQKAQAIKEINDRYRNEKIEYAVQAEQLIQSTAFDIITQGVQQASDAKLRLLDAQKSAELDNASLTATQKRLIENKYANLEKQEKIKAFKANQKLQAANAFINGAVAVLKNNAELGFLPAIPINALTIATTVASIAKILSAKPGFATGGMFESDGKGAMLPGYSKSDNTNARLRSGEAVVVSEAMRVPWARNQVSRINEMFGGRSFSTPSGPKPAFATGGIFTDGGNANRYYNQPVVQTEGLANSLAYQLINNFPPIFTDVKDVIDQIGIKNQTLDRVTL